MLDRAQVFTQSTNPILSDQLCNPCLELRHQSLGNGDDLMSTVGRQHKLGASIVWVRDSSDIPMRLQVLNELRHGLLGHLGPLGEEAHGCSGVVEVLEDRAVCRADHPVPPFRQSSNDEIVECYERLSHQDGQVCWTFSTF